MLMDIKCSVVNSIRVYLTFDDSSSKECVVAIGDLVDVTYNANGLRKRVIGKVLKVSAIGTDPRAWYIVVDASDDFSSTQVKFSPMSILDIDIIRKADTMTYVQTITGEGSIPYIRINKGRLQWSKDGDTWNPINIDSRDIIEDQEGTVTDDSTTGTPRPPKPQKDDGIEEAEW